MSKELYIRLGLDENATTSEIKTSFRKLAKRHHCDTGDGNRDKLAAAQEAYDILVDEDTRRAYDETGAMPTDDKRLDAVAKQTAVSLIISVVEHEGSKADFIFAAKAHAEGQGRKIATEINRLKGVISQLEDAARRVKHHRKQTNLLAQVLKNQASVIKEDLAAATKAVGNDL